MKQIDIKVLGFVVPFLVSADAAEFNQLAKAAPGTDPCHDSALKQVLFHVTYGDIRSTLVDLIEKGPAYLDAVAAKAEDAKVELPTPVAIATRLTLAGKGKTFRPVTAEQSTDKEGKAITIYKDAKGKTVDTEKEDIKSETPADFANRLVDEGVLTKEQLKELVIEAVKRTPFDPSKKERVASEKKIAATYYKVADSILAAGEEAVKGTVAQLSRLLDREIDVSDAETRREVLAQAVSDNEARERQQAANKYLAMAGVGAGA